MKKVKELHDKGSYIISVQDNLDSRKPELITNLDSLQQKDTYMLFYERNN